MAEKKEHNLAKETELRIELNEHDSIIITLIDGNAEIFGIEMAPNIEYHFNDENVAVFSWYGCKLITFGTCKAMYDSNDTNMVAIVNTHAQLEARRDIALVNGDIGPKVRNIY